MDGCQFSRWITQWYGKCENEPPQTVYLLEIIAEVKNSSLMYQIWELCYCHQRTSKVLNTRSKSQCTLDNKISFNAVTRHCQQNIVVELRRTYLHLLFESRKMGTTRRSFAACRRCNVNIQRIFGNDEKRNCFKILGEEPMPLWKCRRVRKESDWTKKWIKWCQYYFISNCWK